MLLTCLAHKTVARLDNKITTHVDATHMACLLTLHDMQCRPALHHAWAV